MNRLSDGEVFVVGDNCVDNILNSQFSPWQLISAGDAVCYISIYLIFTLYLPNFCGAYSHIFV